MKRPVLLVLACGCALLFNLSGISAEQSSREADLLRQSQQGATAFGASLELAAIYRNQGRTDDAVRMLHRAITIVSAEGNRPFDGAVSPPLPPTGPVRVGGDVREPEQITDVPPAYPESARAKRLSGTVVVEFVIDTTGKVGTVRVLKSSPPFDEPAMRAVRQWRFKPTVLYGWPVSVMKTAAIEFRP